MKFSERQGIIEPSTVFQTNDMSEELRASLWNVLHIKIWKNHHFLPSRLDEWCLGEDFSINVYANFLKEPLDDRPDAYNIVGVVRKMYFLWTWYEVYDFIEWLVEWANGKAFLDYESLGTNLNAVLKRELSGFHLINGHFTTITDQIEVDDLQQALADDSFPGVKTHLETALVFLSHRENPDYRNSIKESISAVESMCQHLTGNSKVMLSDALKEIEETHGLHGALKGGFLKLYGYTSDEDGIRHAMMDESDITQADAKYMLVSCTAFVNYLKTLI